MTQKAIGVFLREMAELENDLAVFALRDNIARVCQEHGTPLEKVSMRWDDTNGDRLRYAIVLKNGQALTVIIDRAFNVVERIYSDRGDIHRPQMLWVINGWQKTVEQARSGGRPPGPGKTKNKYPEIYEDYLRYTANCQRTGDKPSRREFCRSYGYSLYALSESIRRAARI